MIKRIFCLLPFIIGTTLSYAQTGQFLQPKRGFTSWQPAENWEQSLLTGNGTMGAMVTGQPYDETIILSHAALYLPQKRSGKVYEQKSQLAAIKKMLLAGKYAEAGTLTETMRKEQGFDDIRDPFIPAFDLKIEQSPKNIIKYQRSVNFETGEAIVDWQDEDGTYQRKVFASRTDSVVVVSIKGTTKLNCVINFAQRPVAYDQWTFVKDGIKEMKAGAEEDYLSFSSEFNHKYPKGLTGYTGLGKLIQKGGSHQLQNGRLLIKDADEITILIKIKPAYAGISTLIPQLKSDLTAIANKNYQELIQQHSAVHGALFSKVKLDLEGSAAERNLSSEALIQLGNHQNSKVLIERTFDAGRYNILSATGSLPPNLQGLWSGTWTAPWSSGFTVDGNLPTAISILMPGNMPELMKGYFDYHEKQMDDYRQEAKQLYGTRGIHIPVQITTRGVETDFGAIWCLTYWTGGAGWTANFFNDYYLYTGDKKFLQEHAYPFMKEAALFYEDFLKTGADGKLLFNPSYSPENNPKGIEAQATINATMDVMIAKQLLNNCIAAAKTLHTDPGKIKLWQNMLSKMPAYEINKEGALREWIWPGLEDNYSHRHASQLYDLYDGVSLDFQHNPALAKAAGVLLDKKMDFRKAEGGGEMAFGLVQLGSAAAHLGDAAKAGQLLNWLASTYWSKGMGSYHNVKSMFNTDISGGLPYLVTQLLCYAERDEIHVLPALPESWTKGKIEGLLLRGQITVNKLEWNGQEAVITLRSPVSQSLKVSVGTSVVKIELKAGKTQTFKLKR